MKKYSFKNDYSEGAHPNILKQIINNNDTQEEGYGEDSFCIKAKTQILKQINKNKPIDIHFVSGGTQANLIAISSILKLHESVISANTAHIAVHEAGAIEATGHKINTINTLDGKLTPDNIQPVLDFHVDEHMVKPKLVFISNSTEIGSVYNKQELEKLSLFCKKNNLYLYLDGARIGAALTAMENNLTLSDMGEYLDIFYIGGTKNGALLGEAIVIVNDILKENFRFYLKQKGALLAKQRIIGIQFLELFNSNLFFDLAIHANTMANKLAKGIKQLDYDFLIKPETNQIFPIFPNTVITQLNEKFDFYTWSKVDEKNSAVRLVTSWATKQDFVNQFLKCLSNIK